MLEPEKLNPKNCATISIDCLNTFMKADGNLSISAFQHNVKGLDQSKVQAEIDASAKRMGELRRFLFEQKVPQIQFQDAHVIESIHGCRFHSSEIVREGQEPDFIRTFPAHALLDEKRRFGTPDQQAIEEIALPTQKIFIHWFHSDMPQEATLEAGKELIFMKDDFCMTPGSPFIHRLFWELRRQGRFSLIILGVCDEICNLRNVLLMLSAIFNVIYVKDCTFPLDAEKRDPAIDYMQEFNPFGEGKTGKFLSIDSVDFINCFGRSS